MNVALPEASETLIIAAGGLMFCWLFYRQRVGIAQWVAAELLAFCDAARARKARRSHWHEHLKEEARSAKVFEWRAR
jgi:hypothetical protein